jgi:hypothetical protein
MFLNDHKNSLSVPTSRRDNMTFILKRHSNSSNPVLFYCLRPSTFHSIQIEKELLAITIPLIVSIVDYPSYSCQTLFICVICEGVSLYDKYGDRIFSGSKVTRYLRILCRREGKLHRLDKISPSIFYKDLQPYGKT